MHFASYYRWLVYQHLFGKPAPNKLLDIGSDDGGFIARIPANLSIAVDASRAALAKAPAHLRICADGTRLPFHAASFDHVVLSDVVEHVAQDQALIADTTRCVTQAGTLWLSTTAHAFGLFPAFITQRAERSWGHVRKGYIPHQLVDMIGEDFDCQVIEWPELLFRHTYLLLWGFSKFMPAIARILAHICFLVDRRLPRVQQAKGHIYIQAVRRIAAE